MPSNPIYLTARQCSELLTTDDVLAEIERVVSWDAAGRVRWPSPPNMNMRDRFENHYHLKACILDDISVAGFRLVSHNATDETSQDATRFVVLVDVESSRPLAFVDAGRLATTALEYYARLFRLHEVRIASRRPETRAALAARAGSRYGIT